MLARCSPVNEAEVSFITDVLPSLLTLPGEKHAETTETVWI